MTFGGKVGNFLNDGSSLSKIECPSNKSFLPQTPSPVLQKSHKWQYFFPFQFVRISFAVPPRRKVNKRHPSVNLAYDLTATILSTEKISRLRYRQEDTQILIGVERDLQVIFYISHKVIVRTTTKSQT